jgi:hypothetical protein
MRREPRVWCWWENLKAREHMGDTGIHGRITLECILTLWHTQTAVSRSEPQMSLLLVLDFCQ